jgi:hypothetical protein
MAQRDPLIEQLVEKVREQCPEIDDDRFFVAIYSFCEFEFLALRAFAALKSSVINPEGDSRRLLGDFRQLRQTQLMFARELGLTPASLASIRSLLKRESGAEPVDLAALMVRAGPVEPEPKPPETEG